MSPKIEAAKAVVYTDTPNTSGNPKNLSGLTDEQQKIAERLARKLLSAIQIQLPFVYVEKDGKRYYTLTGKQGGVLVDLVVTTDIPK